MSINASTNINGIDINDFANWGPANDGLTDDSLKLQQALDEIGQAGGGVLSISGDILCERDVYIRYDNVGIEGQGRSTNLLMQDGGLIIEGLSSTRRAASLELFDLTRTGTPGPGIHVDGGTGRNGQGVARITFKSVRINGSTGEGWKINGAWIIPAYDCYAVNCETGWLIEALPGATTSGNGVLISNGETQDCDTGLKISDSKSLALHNHVIEGNKNSGVELLGGNKALTINECYFEQNGYVEAPAAVAAGGLPESTDISVGLPGTTQTEQVVTINNNYFVYFPDNEARQRAIDVYRGEGVTIENNYFRHYSGSPIRRVAGLPLSGKTEGNQNTNGTAPVLENSDSLFGNQGHYLETITGDGTTTVFTVTHNLDTGHPASVSIVDQAGFYMPAGGPTVQTNGNNALTVTFDTPPAAADSYEVKVTA